MQLSFALAFIAGILTFFATCLVPVVPMYLAYLGGLSIDPASGGVPQREHKTVIIRNCILFVSGFLIVFSLLGVAATALGRVIGSTRPVLERAGSLFLIVMGQLMMDLVPVRAFLKTYQFPFTTRTVVAHPVNAFFLGLTFGFAWTPCIGPVLASILFLVSRSASSLYGASLLLVFGLGLGAPFIIIGLLFGTHIPKLRRLARAASWLRLVCGVALILIGIAMLFDKLSLLSAWSLRWGAGLVL